jgi:hypothetical protein
LISLVCKRIWCLPAAQTQTLQYALLTHLHPTANHSTLTCFNLFQLTLPLWTLALLL